jgi:hypothetical protein
MENWTSCEENYKKLCYDPYFVECIEPYQESDWTHYPVKEKDIDPQKREKEVELVTLHILQLIQKETGFSMEEARVIWDDCKRTENPVRTAKKWCAILGHLEDTKPYLFHFPKLFPKSVYGNEEVGKEETIHAS